MLFLLFWILRSSSIRLGEIAEGVVHTIYIYLSLKAPLRAAKRLAVRRR